VERREMCGTLLADDVFQLPQNWIVIKFHPFGHGRPIFKRLMIAGRLRETAPMPRKPSAKLPARSVLRLPALDHLRPQFCKATVQSPRSGPTPTPSTISSLGTAPNPDSRSVARSFCDTAMSWRAGDLPLQPLT